MKLEQQVCSLELAKRLKELGVKQESLFQWKEGGQLSGNQSSMIVPTKRPAEYGAANQAWSFYSAFTVAELGELLKNNKNLRYYYNPLMSYTYWICQDITNDATKDNYQYSVTEANARAKMLIYLLENKLIEL